MGSLLGVGITVPGCGDDDDPAAAADGTGGEGDGSSDGDEGNDDETDPCSVCDDDNPCTDLICNEGSCEFEPVVSNECRPQIDVSFPPRGATIAGTVQDAVVTIEGTVSSNAAPIESLTIGGEAVTVSEDGSFRHEVTATTGSNILEFEAADAFGQVRSRIQTFLWSTQYVAPTEPKMGMAPDGLAIFMAQETLDDGDHSEPVDDLATVIESAFANLDLGSLLGGTEPVASTAGYDVYLTDLRIGDSNATLEAIDDGLRLTVTLDDIVGDLDFDCTGTGCVLAGGDGTGGLSIRTMTIVADMQLLANEDHALEVDVYRVETDLRSDDVDIWSNNGWTNFLLDLIRPLIMDSMVEDLSTGLDGTLSEVLGPLLAGGLGGLAFDTTLDLPNLADENTPILVRLLTDFRDTDFHDGLAPPEDSPAAGGVFFQRGGAFVEQAVTPYENLGVPLRAGCGTGEQLVALPRDGALEIGLTDDLLNQILYAAWRGGLLEFPFGGDEEPAEGDGGGGGFGVENLDVQASGLLAPTASDCAEPGVLRAVIGDLKLDASLEFFGEPMTFTAYTTMILRLDVVAEDGGIGIAISEVEEVKTELTINEDDLIGSEPVVADALEFQVVDGLIGALGGGSLGNIALPEIDLSEQLGLPPGSAVIVISTDSVERLEGATLITGHL